MFKKLKGLLSLVICISILCTVMPITSFAEDNAASVTFNGSTEYYATIDAAWAAAVALDTTAENKATIQLLANCTAENTLTNTADCLVLDTNGKTLTTPDAIHPTNNVLCGIGVEGGSLEIIGNGTITGLSSESYDRAILLITGGEVYVNGVTIHNTGKNGSNTVLVKGGSFYLLDGYLLSDNEYALEAIGGKVYLYSGKIESTGRLAAHFDYLSPDIQICYSNKPLYFVDNDTNNWNVISSTMKVHLADNLIMDLEYSDNPDGSDSKTLKNVTEINTTANTEKNYLKIQTYKPSYLFSTKESNTLFKKVWSDRVTSYGAASITAVHFVDLADYDLTDITYSDYSADGDESVKAWMDDKELYIGGYGKIIAGESLAYAFYGGNSIDSITGLEMLDTSNVKDMSQMFRACGNKSMEFTLDLGNNFNTSNVENMSYMFAACGHDSTEFTLNLGNNFDTSNVTDMSGMFNGCGYKSTVFTLDLGEKFDTSNVTEMDYMFYECGYTSTKFTLSLGSNFNTSKVTNMDHMFSYCGHYSDVMSLDLGVKFDTSKVTNMGYMFSDCGDMSDEFTLNLGDHFDTSNVENMRCMFSSCGGNSPVFDLNLGNEFNTSKVTDMAYMFSYTGSLSKVFTLDLGDYFDTSNVTDMHGMFMGCSYGSNTFTLDLGDKFATSKVTDMASMFSSCGEYSKVFTLNLGDKFDTSNVETMEDMFSRCGRDSEVFTLDLGDKFNTSKVTNMNRMFGRCGRNSTAFTTLDLSSFTLGTETTLQGLAGGMFVTKFIFGEGWKDAVLPTSGVFSSDSEIDTTIVGATENLLNYDWASDNRNVDGLKPKTYTVTATAETGGTVSGGGEVTEGESITLTATANDGYTFDGWYDGDTKVCDTAEFTVENITEGKTYTAKFTKTVSRLFSTSDFKTLLDKIKTDGITTYKCDQITAVHFVDLANYNLTDIKYSDYSANKDGSVKAWMNGTELYIGGYGKIMAGERLRSAFWHGDLINSITGLEMLDTSNVTDMSFMFYACGYSSNVFTLDLGDTFNTSNVTDMSYMFYYCGYNCDAFTLDLGANFDTSKVTNMEVMFFRCGESSKAFTTLDLSTFKVSANTNLSKMAREIPVTTFIFGDGWAGAKLPTAGSSTGAFYTTSETDTTIVGATENLLNYKWASDNRNIGGSKPKTYTVTATAETGGSVSGGGTITEGGSITLTATADDGYTFAGWYDGDTKVCDTEEFVVTNVTADKTYTAKFTKNQVVDPDPSEFDFTTIRTLRAKDIVVNHSNKTITMTADGNVKNVAVYQDQQTAIPGGIIKLADAKDASTKQNSGSFYIMNNAGSAVVTVDVTVGGVTKQYTLSVNFNEFVEKNLRMYQRKIGSTQKDIVYGTDVGYVAGNEIHITPDAGVEYIGLTKYQGTPGNYNGIITPVASYPTYSTFEESTSSSEPIFVDWQGCIFVKRPTDGKSVEMEVNYTLGTETSVYKVIVDFSEESEFAFSAIRSERTKNIVIDHEGKTITMDSDGRVSNIAVYKYQLGNQSDMQITLADKLSADVTQNDGSFYIKNNGSGTASVVVDITIGNSTKQYTLTVNFADAFDFTDIRSLRTKNVTVDHKNKTITVDSDGIVSNIAIYKAQNDIIKGGSITLSDPQSASVVQNAGSFYVKDDGSGSAAVLVNVTIGKITKQYTLNVNFSDGFNFDNIRTLRTSEIDIDHDTQKITISASKGAKNVALYMSQTGVINGGKLILTDEKDSLVQKNSGSYYIVKQDGISKSTVLADITVGGKTKNYEITVCFAD